MRRMFTPPCWRANSQLKSAVRALPTCNCPVGDGAKRTRTLAADDTLSMVSGVQKLPAGPGLADDHGDEHACTCVPILRFQQVGENPADEHKEEGQRPDRSNAGAWSQERETHQSGKAKQRRRVAE